MTDLASSSDHRIRTGEIRRQKTRSRLLAAAMLVLGQKGVEASIIDEITAVAGTSRGTFYNYFRTNEELLKAVAIAAGNDMMRAVAPVVESRDDPVWRNAAGIRGWLTIIAENPHLAAFFQRAGLYVLEQNTMIRVDMPRDVIAGIESGRFTIDRLEVGFDIVAGTVLSAINTIAAGQAGSDHAERIAQRILMALGIGSEEAWRLANDEIPKATLPRDAVAVLAAAMAKDLSRFSQPSGSP